MKKTPGILLIASILLIYLGILAVGMAGRQADTPPDFVDGQSLTIDRVRRVDGGVETPVTLPAYFDMEGELCLRATLDYSFSGHTAPSLIVQSNHSFMTVLLDGEELWRVPPTDHSLGNYFLRVPLPGQARGAQLEVRISVPEGGLTRIQVPALTVAEQATYQRALLLDDIPSLLLNLLIFFCGLLVIGLSFASRVRVDIWQMLLRGLLALDCAIYFMCETAGVVYLAGSARMVYLFDMLSFALLSPLLLLLLGWELQGWRRRLVRAVTALGLINALGQAALGLTGVAELRPMLPLTHATQIVSILAVLCCVVYALVRREKKKMVFSYSVLAVAGAADILLFLTEHNRDNVFFMKIALLFYLLQQLSGFVHLLMAQSAQTAREEYYKELAMQDPLTHCHSRAAFEIDRAAWDGGTARTVFSLDLNNLKQTNDFYGHSMGDLLLRGLGEVLNQVFFSLGKCYRVGGDEFWVFCEGLTPDRAAALVETAQKVTQVRNAGLEPPARVSYAIGLCDTGETDGNLERAISLADARMYENKRGIKAGGVRPGID